MQEFLREPNNTQISQFVLNHFPDTPGNTQAQRNEAYFQRIQDIKWSLQKELEKRREVLRGTAGDLHSAFKVLGLHNSERHKFCEGERCVHRMWSHRTGWSSPWNYQLRSTGVQECSAQSLGGSFVEVGFISLCLSITRCIRKMINHKLTYLSIIRFS